MIRREESQNFLNLNLHLCRAIAPQGPPIVLQDQNGLFYAPDLSSLAIPSYNYLSPPPFIPFMSQHDSTAQPSTTSVATNPNITNTARPSGSPLRSNGSNGGFEQLVENSQQSSEQSSRASTMEDN